MNQKIVLIVDDDAAMRGTLADILSNEGYAPITVGTCAEALAIARERGPGAALVDIELPDGSGTDLLSSLSTDFRRALSVIEK
jgi:DNA-binding response OmpR family regulator